MRRANDEDELVGLRSLADIPVWYVALLRKQRTASRAVRTVVPSDTRYTTASCILMVAAILMCADSRAWDRHLLTRYLGAGLWPVILVTVMSSLITIAYALYLSMGTLPDCVEVSGDWHTVRESLPRVPAVHALVDEADRTTDEDELKALNVVWRERMAEEVRAVEQAQESRRR